MLRTWALYGRSVPILSLMVGAALILLGMACVRYFLFFHPSYCRSKSSNNAVVVASGATEPLCG